MAQRLGSAWARIDRTRPYLALFTRRIIWTIPPVWWFKEQVGELIWVDGQSMYPFLNDRYNETTAKDVCWSFKYNAQTDLKRGMVVTFWHPFDPYKLNVKRVTALAGDVVYTKPPYPTSPVTVPDGHVWVEGDNGTDSRDSNTYGPVSARLIEGRITHILYPPYKSGRVKWWEWEEQEESRRARRTGR